jgi:RNA polymerase sigma factor (sigma-70 family)
VKDPLADPAALVDRVYGYVAYVLGDGPDAEDVTSETFERALRYRASYDPQKGTPTAWLIGIARRRIADRRARPVEPRKSLLADPVVGEISAEDILARLAVQRAIESLDERDRELVALRYGADLTAAQIGVLLGLRTNAIEVALHRVHARLRPLLAELQRA